MAEHVADQEQRAGDTDNPAGGGRGGALERLGGRAGDADVDARRDQRPQGVGRRGAGARGRDQNESTRERYERARAEANALAERLAAGESQLRSALNAAIREADEAHKALAAEEARAGIPPPPMTMYGPPPVAGRGWFGWLRRK